MQETFQVFFNKKFSEKLKSGKFWLTHMFFYFATILICVSGGSDSPFEGPDFSLMLTAIVLYPVLAILYETYQIYSTYKKSTGN